MIVRSIKYPYKTIPSYIYRNTEGGMKHTDRIEFLALQEGVRLRKAAEKGRMESHMDVEPHQREEGESRADTITYFGIDENQDGRLKAFPQPDEIMRALGRPFPLEAHDNAPRLAYVCSFLNDRVLPYLDPGHSTGVKGTYAIELHDSYTHLSRSSSSSPSCAADKAYKSTLVFSRDRSHPHPVLLPDPYQMGNYGGIADGLDTVPWEKKKPSMFFAGTTTGERDPERNARIQACLWSLESPVVLAGASTSSSRAAEFYITRVAQMNEADALRRLPRLKDVMHAPFPSDAHREHRIGMNIAGNTCSWSRVPSILSSRSVLFDAYQRDICWWHPAMVDGTHYVSVDLPTPQHPSHTNIMQKFVEVAQSKQRCAAIADAANDLVANYTRSVHAAQYTKHLLERSADLFAA